MESLQDYHYGGHKDFQVDASWAEKLTKTRVPFQKAPTLQHLLLVLSLLTILNAQLAYLQKCNVQFNVQKILQ